MNAACVAPVRRPFLIVLILLILSLLAPPLSGRTAPPLLQPETQYTLPFSLAQVLAHPDGQRLFGRNYLTHEVFEIALADGEVLARHAFEHPVAAIALTPDGEHLYAGLVTLADCCRLEPDAPQEGALAEFDLRTGAPPRVFPVASDPFDLVATDQQVVMLTTHSGQAASLLGLDAGLGSVASTVALHARSPLALHPNQRALYAVEETTSAFTLQRIDFDPITRNLTRSASTRVDSQLRAWVLPAGDRLITQDNRVYRLTPDPADDLQPLAVLPGDWAYDIVASEANGVLYRLSLQPGSDRTRLDLFQLRSLAPLENVELAANSSQLFHTSHGLCLVEWGAEQTRVLFFRDVGLNLEPVARFTLQPDEGITTLTDLRLDASLSSDNVDTPGNGLRFRWDINGDGDDERPFEVEPVKSIRLRLPGTYVIGLEVEDRFGLRSRTQRTVHVTAATDTGRPGDPHEPRVFDGFFRDAFFDTAAGQLYASSSAGELLRISLTNGLVERRWQFGPDLRPGALAHASTAGRLYVALEPAGVVPLPVPGAPGHSWIAEFDLALGVKIREFPVQPYPSFLASTPDGLLAVHGGGNPPNQLATYRGPTGERLDSTSLRWPARIAPHPTGRFLVAQSEWVDVVELDPASGKLGTVQSTGLALGILGEANPLFRTDGSAVLFSSGHLNPSTTTGIDPTTSVFLGLGNLAQIVSLPDRGLTALVSPSQIGWLREPTLAWFLGRPTPGPARFAGYHTGQLWVVTYQDGVTRLQAAPIPATHPDQNQAPTIALIQPADGTVIPYDQSIVVEAVASDEDGEVRAVTFLANGEVLARSDASTPGQTRFAASWIPPTPGRHTLTAIAEDNLGRTTHSTPVAFIGNRPPIIEFIRPKSSDVFDPPHDLVIEVDARDEGGRIVQVDLVYRPNSVDPPWPLGTFTTPPYRVELKAFPHLEGWFEASALDDLGTRTSTTVQPVLRGAEGDDYRRPFLIEGLQVTTSALNSTATVQTGEPRFTETDGSGAYARTVHHSLWWAWKAPTNGIASVRTDASSFDTLLVVYRLSTGGSTTLVGGNDDAPGIPPFSRIKYLANAGVTYLIGVAASRSNEVGRAHLRIDLEVAEALLPPPNDKFTSRTTLPSTPNVVEQTGPTDAATADPSEPAHANSPARHSVWWSWRPPVGPGRITVSTAGSDFDTVLALYTGTSLTSLRSVAANDDAAPNQPTSEVAFDQPGASPPTYAIAVDGYAGATGRVQLTVRWEPTPNLGRPPNDLFTNAARIEGPMATLHASNANATAEPGEPTHSPQGAPATRSVWWTWTATSNAHVYLVTTTAAPHVLAVYTGDQTDHLVKVAHTAAETVGLNLRRGLLRFVARAGTPYRIAFDSPGTFGTFDLVLNATLPLDPPILEWTRPEPLGLRTLRVRVASPADVRLERSNDLQLWNPWQTNRVETQLEVPVPTDAAKAFFRAVTVTSDP